MPYIIFKFLRSHSFYCDMFLTPLMTYSPSYEAHYNSLHRHCCQNCQRSFPSTHLLEIHVLENHDTLFGMLASRKNLVTRKCSMCLLLPFDYLNLMEDIFSSTFPSTHNNVRENQALKLQSVQSQKWLIFGGFCD